MPRPKNKKVEDKKPRKGRSWSPEQRAAASERMRMRQNAKFKALAEEKGPEALQAYEESKEQERERVKREIQQEFALLVQEMVRRREEEAIRYYKPNRAQAKFHYAKNRMGGICRNRGLQGSNKVGKTRGGVDEDIAHALGYRPWLPKEHPDYKINIHVPNNGLILGETITASVDKKLVPELLKQIPKRCFGPAGEAGCTKKNPQGVITKIKLPFGLYGEKCGSTIHLGSYDQKATDQEGIDWDWVHYDEPPPHENYISVERGKIASDARSWMTMTPLKEPWILDELVEKADFDDDISFTSGIIWDNLDGYFCEKCGWFENTGVVETALAVKPAETVLKIEGNVDWTTKLVPCPECGQKAMFMGGVLKKEAIVDFIKKLDPDEADARVWGKWKHLSGLVYAKWWRDEVHVIEDFSMEKCFRAGWTPYESVDPHDNRATCWLFAAMGPNNRLYVYDYLLVSGTVAEIVQKVRVKRGLHGYTEPKIVVLDKKHGQKHNAALADGKSWQSELEAQGIKRIELSDSSAGDVDFGHKKVKEWLEPVFSTLHDKEIPRLMFFKQACSGPGGPIYQMKRYSYDDMGDAHEKNPNPKPKDLNKDFPDCVRYLVMKDPKYVDPSRAKANKEAMQRRYDEFVGVRRRMYGGYEARV